jgi:hypothetical protein
MKGWRSSKEMPLPDVSEARTQRAAMAVMAYLARHPLAADNEAGIAQVWLPEASLRDALDRLVGLRLLERVLLADGSAIYRALPTAPAA